MAALKQQVALQETSVAVLNSLNQQVVAQQTTIAVLAPLKEQVAVQATRITLLETRVALAQATVAQPRPATGVATVAPITPQPTPTMLPAVAGLVTDGATKGAASAKVTITEYVDYL